MRGSTQSHAQLLLLLLRVVLVMTQSGLELDSLSPQLTPAQVNVGKSKPLTHRNDVNQLS